MEKNMKNYVFICVQLNHFGVHQQLTHCKLTILQYEKLRSAFLATFKYAI